MNLIYRCGLIWIFFHVAFAVTGQSTATDRAVSVSPVIIPGTIPDYSLVIECLNHFISTKNIDPYDNNYWSEYDFSEYKTPFSDIYFIEVSQKYNSDYHYKPTLIEIIKTGTPDQFILKIAFIGHDENDGSNVRAIYNILAEKDINNAYKLRKILRYNTRNWPVEKMNTIRYVITPTHKFNLPEAKNFHNTNLEVARFFEEDPIQFTYYLCSNLEEILRIKGFDYVHDMYASEHVGHFELHNTIFSGSDSESNVHDMVHGYLRRADNQSHWMLTEGLATYIGGSRNENFTDHLHHLNTFLESHRDTALYKYAMEGGRLENNIFAGHVVGALICHLALEDGGRKKLFKMMETGYTEEELLQALALIGINKENFDQKVKEAVKPGYIKNTLWQDAALR